VSKPFRIGMNCDADKQFNNDPKDPNKYEIEGLKTQSTGVQVAEYLMKMVEEHPLITYIEDPMAECDADSARKLKVML
jgi:enolase